MIALWGSEAGGGPCDANFDGVVGIADFVALLSSWGTCVAPASAMPQPRLRDTNGAGRVDVGGWLAELGGSTAIFLHDG